MDLLEKKFHDTNKKNFIRHPWEVAREKIIIRILKRFSKGQPYQHTDMGSGDGYIVGKIAEALPKGVYDGVDIELTPEDQAFLNKQYQNKIHFHQSLQDVATLGNIPHSITFMDVLEHIEQDAAAVEAVSERFKNEVPINYFVTVPAFQFLFTDHDVFLKHYRRYNIKMLKNTFQQAGLDIKETHYFFFTLFLARAIKKLLFSIMGKKEQANHSDLIWNYGQTMANIVTQILLLDYEVLRLLSKVGIKLPGLSVYGHAVKN